jgi:site-specific DNA-cytosine methylase
MTLIHKVEQQGGFGMKNCLVNRHILGQQWTSEVGSYLDWSAPHADALFANPPCSGFSVMTDKRWRGVDAKVNHCMHVTMEYAARVVPEIVVMESVRVAYSSGHSLMTKLREELEEKSGHKYELYHVMQNAVELGGAAIRPRYFFVASQIPFGVEFPDVPRPVLDDVIGDLDGLGLTWEAQPYRRPATWWSENARSSSGVVDGHVTVKSPYVARSLDLLEMSGEWPNGWPIARVAKKLYEERGELPPSWSHLTERLVAKEFNMGFTTMVRWHGNRPARVITGGAMQSVMHPHLPRSITHREAARIMGFPDDWRIKPLKGTSGLAATWGKGITTQCGKWIATWVQNALDGNPGTLTGEEVGDREHLITASRVQARTLVRS